MKRSTYRHVFVLATVASLFISQTVNGQVKSTPAAAGSARKAQHSAAEKSRLAKGSKAAEPATLPDESCHCLSGDTEAEARFERALGGRLSAAGLDYADVPLNDIVQQFQSDYDI